MSGGRGMGCSSWNGSGSRGPWLVEMPTYVYTVW